MFKRVLRATILLFLFLFSIYLFLFWPSNAINEFISCWLCVTRIWTIENWHTHIYKYVYTCISYILNVLNDMTNLCYCYYYLLLLLMVMHAFNTQTSPNRSNGWLHAITVANCMCTLMLNYAIAKRKIFQFSILSLVIFMRSIVWWIGRSYHNCVRPLPNCVFEWIHCWCMNAFAGRTSRTHTSR